jgi:predicted nucleic acid-binding protein
VEALERLTAMPVLRIDNPDAVHRAIVLARRSKHDVADLLIGCCAAAGG